MSEEFVQKAIIKWLKSKGYRLTKDTYKLFGIDIKAYNLMGKYYFVECRGEAEREDGYLNFCAGLGQLILRINKDIKRWRNYGFGLPDTKHFERQYKKFLSLPSKLRRTLRICFLFVNEKGEVKEVKSW